MNIRIFPPDEMLEASVDLPLSKSIAARSLVINAIGKFEESAPLPDCQDIEVLKNALCMTRGEINIGMSGTAMRFLTAYFAATDGCEIVLTGDERMSLRPVSILVKALREMGASIDYLDKEGFLPLKITGKKLSGCELTIDSTVSSQFISALMLVAPLLDNPLTIRIDGEAVSVPYIKMTAAMMAESGVEPVFRYNGITVPNSAYGRPSLRSERDWSSASYWYAITALSAGWVTLNDISVQSLQGDSELITLGEKFGVLTNPSEDVDGALELSVSPEQFSRLDADMSQTPDLVPALAVTAAVLGIPFRFTGVRNLRDKECDRLTALCQEALKIGRIFEVEGDDILSWEGQHIPVNEMPVFSTHGDHRMAMAFAPVSIFVPGIVIEDYEVVRKSYPDFWTHLEQAGFILEKAD